MGVGGGRAVRVKAGEVGVRGYNRVGANAASSNGDGRRGGPGANLHKCYIIVPTLTPVQPQNETIPQVTTMVMIEEYHLPDDLYYHSEHAWVKLEEDGTARVGMNDFYQRTAGDTTYIDLPFEGDEVEQGETCGKIQSAKWVGKFVAPLSGEIIEINEELEDDCTLINTDPYGNGWIMKMRPSSLDEELGSLMKGPSVEPWIMEKIAEIQSQK